MSDIKPEVTDRLVAYLRSRTRYGDDKYGTPLLPFDGRHTLKDALEEATDLSQYLMKEVMEREAVANLLGDAIDLLENMGHEGEILGRLYDTEEKLRQDIKRIEPEEVSPAPLNYQCHSCGEFTATYTNGHRDICEKCWITTAGALHYQKFRLMPEDIVLGEDVTDQFVKRAWTPEEVSAKIAEINNEAEYD